MQYTDDKKNLNAVDQTPATNTVTNHLSPDSASQTFATAGTGSWPALFSDDAPTATTYTLSLHDALPIYHPSVATTLSDDASPTPNTAAGGSTLTVPVGTAVHDAAVISGATSSAGGTIAYAYLARKSVAAGTVDQPPSPATLTNHLAPDSAAPSFTTAATSY